MTDTEILDAIIEHHIWVHPAGGFHTGWTACVEAGANLAWNRPTLRQAIEEVVTQINKEPQA